MVNVPIRNLSAKFSRSSKVMVAVPLPPSADVINTQLSLLNAVQLQPAGALIVTLPLPPVRENAALVEEREKAHEEILATKESLNPPPLEGWNAPGVVGKFVEDVSPAT